MPKDTPQQQLEGGAYEVIRARLAKHADDLRTRLDKLNSARQDVFGAVETKLLSTAHVGTEHNCVPRDLLSLGNGLYLLGYNIQFGLKQTTDLQDVFSLFRLDEENQFHQLPVTDALGDAAFQEDFVSLFRFYKSTLFVKFMLVGPHVHMKMRIGRGEDDFKTFKWLARGDGKLEYVGNRFDHECRYPDTVEFEWKRAHRDMQRSGAHPHISIEDRVFVETVGGDLTIKIEDNTRSGEGIYSEPVTDSDQTLDDAEVLYAIIGPLILLRILPYREDLHRHLLFNEKTRTVHRLDGIGESCVLLPEDQGILFANGYALATGEVRTFDTGLSKMRFERRTRAENGEDTLFVFYQRGSGHYVLFSYNLIAQTVGTPLICTGFAIDRGGRMVLFQSQDEALKHHALQIWQTPFTSDEGASIPAVKRDSFLFKIGNSDLVRGMAECREILTLLGKDDTYGDLYIDLVRRSRGLLDGYFWLTDEKAEALGKPLEDIHQTANAAIEEFDKVIRLRQATADRTAEVRKTVETLLARIRTTAPDNIRGFVQNLAELRQRRGEVVGLRDLRYNDAELIEQLDTSIATATDSVSEKTVDFLLADNALAPYEAAVTDCRDALQKLVKTAEADAVSKNLDAAAAELEMLIDVVGNLRIEDATRTTAIIESVSGLYATLNGVRAELRSKRRELAQGEGAAQFGAQMKLLAQSVVNYLDLCDTPEKCGEFLTKTMVQVEELEGRFAEFDDYIEELARKREEVYEAFEGRKQTLVEQRNRRAGNLMKSAERLLGGISHRASSLDDLDALNGYFAGDLMVSKLRDTVDEFRALGDSVKADDVQTRLKSLQDDAIRQLRDRSELFAGGRDVISFGRHRFSVNTQELALSIVPHDGTMCFHLSGTAFFEPVTDEGFLATRPVWDQEIVSENREVYRAEWLAYRMLMDLPDGDDTMEAVHAFIAPRYAEGYLKGVHDEDGRALLNAVRPIHNALGLLRYAPTTRALAMLFWENHRLTESGQQTAALLSSHSGARKAFGASNEAHPLVKQLLTGIEEFLKSSSAAAEAVHAGGGDDPSRLAAEAAAYLFEDLTTGGTFAVSKEASDFTAAFKLGISRKHAVQAFDEALQSSGDDPQRRFLVIQDWMLGHSRESSAPANARLTPPAAWVAESAAHWMRGGFEQLQVVPVATGISLTGLRGQHAVIAEGGTYASDYHMFRRRLQQFEHESVPRFESCARLKQTLVDERRETLRLDEFKPKVMSSFVRNKLINDVYLPLVGANLAKQIGTAGKDARTDRSGMLLVVSPPGYGKTTLMEYVANRLGLTFMKINGPALGHQVVSLDPSEAPNLSAREEVDKVNLALEMGDNVMIYLDDIQHTSPEFLQRFISLCDAQRRMEGVWNGKARTYDLRGKKVAVVMAGNPYTEGGTKFKIPDMLANRADTYNLGDILGGHLDAFLASYVENSLTSNPVLAKLTSRHQEDVYAVMKIAETGNQEGVDFKGNYAPAEIDEMVAVMKHLFTVRNTILNVNQEYIRSAAQEDAYRTEPPFKLQGSYRNMNRIAERIVPLMNPAEVRALIDDHYQNESQTLTQGTESNLLRFKELEGIQTAEETQRWADIKKEFMRRRLMGGADESDPVTRVVAQLSQFQMGLESIKDVISQTGKDYVKPQTLAESTVKQLKAIIAGLRAVPVEVEIKVVPVQAEGGVIENVESTTAKSPIDIQPVVRQDTDA